MRFCLILLVLGAGLIDQGEAISKCNEEIIGKIKKIWGPTPPAVLEQIKAAGKMTVIGSTKDYFDIVKVYFPGQKSFALKCASGIFNGGKFDITFVPKEGQAKTESYPIKEEAGAIIYEDKDMKQVRYHFFFEGNVAALYTCNEKGADSDTTPDGIIKVKDGYQKAAVDKAKAKAKELGINITEVYPDKCEAGGEAGGAAGKGKEAGGKKKN